MSRRLAPRDQGESAFSRILEEFWRAHERVLAAVFVDRDGECIDYCASIDPYEARVAGATMYALLRPLEGATERLGAGLAWQWLVECDGRDLLMRLVSDEYGLVIVGSPGVVSARLLAGLEAVAIALRREAGIDDPLWDPACCPYVVKTRPAVAWGYAPERIEHGEHVRQVADVLGRWTERGAVSLEPLVCFRVRCERQEEFTLVHDPALGRWFRR